MKQPPFFGRFALGFYKLSIAQVLKKIFPFFSHLVKTW